MERDISNPRNANLTIFFQYFSELPLVNVLNTTGFVMTKPQKKRTTSKDGLTFGPRNLKAMSQSASKNATVTFMKLRELLECLSTEKNKHLIEIFS